MIRRIWTATSCGLLVAALLGSSSASYAQNTSTVAEALFREGRRLVEKGDFTNACPKLAESFRLDPATGALLVLAICHEGQGKVASAWTEYVEVAARSKREGRADRENAARAKASALEPTLSTLTIEVPERSRVEGLRVSRGGQQVLPASFGLAIPVDPGEYVAEASAVGRRSWQTTVKVGPNAQRVSIEVPELEREPAGGPAAAPAPVEAARPVMPAAPPRTPSVTAPPGRAPEANQDRSGQGLTTAAYLTLGAAAVSLVIGGVFVTRALINKSDYEADPACEFTCPALERANTAADAATGFGIGALALGAVGTTLLLLRPTNESAAASSGGKVRIASDGRGIAIAGRF